MSVLARELDSYQRALDIYQRQMNRYNRGVDQYRQTLVRDANGNILITMPGSSFGGSGGEVKAVGPDGTIVAAAGGLEKPLTEYGLTPIPGNEAFRMLRQNPTSANRETVSGVKKYVDVDPETGERYYYIEQNNNDDYRRIKLGNEWRMDETVRGREYNDYSEPTTYVFSRDASEYLKAPEEWTKTFDRKAPEATAGQVRRMGMPSLAEIEGGLIGEVMKGSGVRQGVPVYRPKKM